MKIAYLMDQHPYLSSTFIRREIVGLEEQGIEVVRFSIRQPEITLLDNADKLELEKTRFILSAGAASFVVNTVRLLFGLLHAALSRPLQLMKAASLNMKLARASKQYLRHAAYLAEACILLRWCSELGVTFVHAHFGKNATTVALLCHRLGGPRYSFTAHGSGEFDEPRQIGLPEKIRWATFVVAISSFARSQLYRWSEHANWSKIHEIHCCVDKGYLTAASSDIPDELRLVCVGALCEEKGQLLLIEAAAQLADEGLDFSLVLVGDGPLRSEIEALIDRLDLHDRIALTGWASGAEVREQILASRIMVLPSFAEGLPVVVMEALALRRPVLSTCIAGIPELVVPGCCGWLIPPGSVTALADCMREALNTPIARLNEMGKAGAARVAERHDIATEAVKLKKLLERAHGIQSADE